jgi:hypothetical protein
MRMAMRSCVAVLLLILCAGATQAQTRAWLDRDRIESGETATLNIETDQLVATPEYAPLLRDFALSGHTSRRSMESVNGRTTTRTLFAVALEPRREGVIGIPSLRVGNATTAPLTLTVVPPSAAPAQAGDVAFLETDIDADAPYVQQAVGVTVRLYYAVPLVSGELEQPEPQGATLRKVGEDLQYTREAGGRRYNVVERRYLLIAERSGPLTLPGAHFRGQGVGGFFDDIFGDGRRALNASSRPRILQVRAAPANAPQPWLPLRELQLRYVSAPQRARAGEAATVVIEALADGATASQLPELQLDAGSDAQVFAEPVRADERFVEGRPRTILTRRFSIVPAKTGRLQVAPPRIDWWDARRGVARTATLPPLALDVAAGVAPAKVVAPAPPTPTDDDGRISIPGIQGRVLPWAAAAALFALLWFVTLFWALHRRPATENTTRKATPDSPPSPVDASMLRRTLAEGDLGAIADALCALATPPVKDLDTLHARLDDDMQRDAITLLQRARWGGGNAPAARAALRKAFADGPRWKPAKQEGQELLPPLYPR